jgi:hypothetical protein
MDVLAFDPQQLSASRADILSAVVCGKFSRTALCWEMRAALATLAQGASFGTTANVWNWYAEGSG